MNWRRLAVAMVVVACFGLGLAFAQDKGPEPKPKETKGQIAGQIVKKDGGKLTVKGEQGELVLMPHWRGGAPKDGGGFDKDTLKKLEEFKVGDKVKVSWVFEEHYRIESIVRSE